MIHLLIPMSGQGTRYQKAGYTEPKPLIPVNGVPMIERLLLNFPERWPCHFVLAENHKSTSLPKLLNTLRSNAEIYFIPPHSQGPSFALLEGLQNIPENDPVFVSYCDYGMVWDPAQFERFVAQSECDACLVSYKGFHAHYLNPVTYAYSRMENQLVVQVKEKGSFTSNRENEYASSGGYYFKTAALLKNAIDFQIKNNLKLNGEFYTSLTVEALLQSNPNAHVRVFEIPGFFQWGTPEDLQNFEYWEKTFQNYNKFIDHQSEVAQVLMPMAGLGSRFTDVTPIPKPFIPIEEVPMFQRALQSLPKANHTIVVSLKSVREELNKHIDAFNHSVLLDQTPAGQALSTAEGISALDLEKEVLISSCDHGIVLDPNAWKKFKSNPDCDAAIFTISGFPGAVRKPNSYAYVVPENDTDEFPIIKSVSVKKPVSGNPLHDHVLVGTFWFKSGKFLSLGIEELIKQQIRVNGELYLDSVFECVIKKNFIVRQIPLQGYICWGDKDAFSESLYWQEIFCGHRIEKRPQFPGVKKC